MTNSTNSQLDSQIGLVIQYRVHGMLFRASEPLRIDVRSPSPVAVVFSRKSLDGLAAPESDNECFLMVLTRRKPQQAVLNFLHELKPGGSMPERPHHEFKADYQGKARGLCFASPTGGPKEYESFVAQLQQELYNIAASVVALARWRVDASGPHQPFVELCNCFFTWDGENYLGMSLPGGQFLEFKRDLYLTDEQKADVISYFEQGVREPFAHRMFREAWVERVSSPRSALIAGVAALEIGVKETIAALVPDAEWLVMNLPSPDVLKILREGLPKLPVRLKIDGKVLAPPNEVLDLLRKAITIRNSLAHAGQGDVQRELAQDILAAIRDTLSLLDYYCGREWALCHISRATLDKMPGINISDVEKRIKQENRLQPAATGAGVVVMQLTDLPPRVD